MSEEHDTNNILNILRYVCYGRLWKIRTLLPVLFGRQHVLNLYLLCRWIKSLKTIDVIWYRCSNIDVSQIMWVSFSYLGYRGWGCTDDREATSEIDLLAATLLLCLSNLLFLPAVGLAIYRGFYTESFVYFANMVFSTVYTYLEFQVVSFLSK